MCGIKEKTILALVKAVRKTLFGAIALRSRLSRQGERLGSAPNTAKAAGGSEPGYSDACPPLRPVPARLHLVSESLWPPHETMHTGAQRRAGALRH